jgi:hypothetical protein
MRHEQRQIGFGGLPSSRITSLGRIVEEPFLDEVPGSTGPIRAAEGPSAFELFPDENVLNEPTARTTTGSLGLRLVERSTGAPADLAPAGDVAAVGSRPSLLLLFFVGAALAAFGTVRACQVSGASSVAIWQLLGR